MQAREHDLRARRRQLDLCAQAEVKEKSKKSIERIKNKVTISIVGDVLSLFSFLDDVYFWKQTSYGCSFDPPRLPHTNAYNTKPSQIYM